MNFITRMFPITKSRLLEWYFFFSFRPYQKYSIKYRCIFIHIPKTAGTSILTILNGKTKGREHSGYSVYQKVNPHAFNSFFKFTFVRNPYDRAISAYEYLRKGGNQREDKYYKELFEKEYPTFQDFVLNFLDQDRIHEIQLLKPQYLFIYDDKGNCQVDFVGHFETINEDSKKILDVLKLNESVPFTNRSKRKPIVEYYQMTKVKYKIEELYRKDFELFNYSF